MTSDGGQIGELRVGPPPRPARRLAWIGFGVALTLAFIGFVAVKHHQAQAARDAYWSVADRPSCPAADVQALRGGRPPMTKLFDGATFARRSGFIECDHHPYDLGHGRRDYAVCQFNSPQAVGVAIGQTETIFAQPMGHSLRIVLADDRPICVVIDRLPLK